MKRHLPSLKALLVFDAAAKHLNFTRAAEDLCVTPTAVSHQIRYLEEWFGKKLFTRESRPMALTETGAALFPLVSQGLGRIDEGITRAGRVCPRPTLTVSVTSTFGAWWLAQRLGYFWEKYPEIDFRVHHSTHPADLHRDDVDLAVRWGDGRWDDRDYIKEHLMDAVVTPLCSPKLEIKSLDNLAGNVLLHQRDHNEWKGWLRAAGVKHIDASRGPIIDDITATVQAAIHGSGVFLSLRMLFAEELLTGKLVAPLTNETTPHTAYYLVYLKSALARPEIRAFRDFLVEEASKETLA